MASSSPCGDKRFGSVRCWFSDWKVGHAFCTWTAGCMVCQSLPESFWYSGPLTKSYWFFWPPSEVISPFRIRMITNKNELHGAETFVRSLYVFSQSKNSPNSMEPDGSLPHSHQPTPCPYPEPDNSSSPPPQIPPSIPRSFNLSLSLRFINPV